MKGYKTIHKKHKKKRKGTKKRISSGGRAIDAGTYGCVFSPAIKCAKSTQPYNNNNISKLMFNEDIYPELYEMSKVKKIIKTIPNSENYFIISDTYACKPGKLSQEDLTNFDENCKRFSKRGITSSNVNTQLNNFAMIVMPNGGLNIEKFTIELTKLRKKDMYRNFIIMNEALIRLLLNGILPINAKNFNHYDIKYANILMSADGHARLIDWGMASENDGIRIPEAIQDRSIAFNMPFSDIFFNNYLRNWLPEAINEIKGSSLFNTKNAGQSELLKIVAANMINKSIELNGEGHFDYITSGILHDIYKIYAMENKYNKMDYNVLSYNVVIEYIHAVLLMYVDENGIFNDTNYFYNVFVKNVDIWGFLLSYVPLIEHGVGHFHIDIINGICRILLKYCFSTEFATKPINIAELVLDLQSLSTITSDIEKRITNLTQAKAPKRENDIQSN
jgi:hypothetical protein